jgi:hypothetical protein
MNRPLRLLLPLLLALAAGCDKQKTCSTDQKLCGGTCVTVDTDAANCGACGNVCGPNQQCLGGSCACPEDRDTCGTACVELASDPAHCGACGNACAGALLCTRNDAGVTACAAACAGTGQIACGRACVNLQTNRSNCGACGRACGSREHCTAGLCQADLYLACFASDEIRGATASLAPAGTPLAVAPGPNGLAWAGDLLAVASGRSGSAETISTIRFDAPGRRASEVTKLSSPFSDLEYLVEHEGLLYVSHSSVGTLLIVTPAGAVVDEVRLAPAGAPNPNPWGMAFDAAGRVYLALWDAGEVAVLDVSSVPSCAAGTKAPPCTTEVARLDLSSLATPGALPKPTRVVIQGSHAFVGIQNLNPDFSLPVGGTGRIAVVDTATLSLDATFAGSTAGLLDLGEECVNVSSLTLEGGTLYVSCGGFTTAGIVGSGIARVDVSGTVARVLPMITGSSTQAPGKLAFCRSTGYVADRGSGTVWAFDPSSGSTTLGLGTELCPISQDKWANVADIACGR